MSSTTCRGERFSLSLSIKDLCLNQLKKSKEHKCLNDRQLYIIFAKTLLHLQLYSIFSTYNRLITTITLSTLNQLTVKMNIAQLAFSIHYNFEVRESILPPQILFKKKKKKNQPTDLHHPFELGVIINTNFFFLSLNIVHSCGLHSISTISG